MLAWLGPAAKVKPGVAARFGLCVTTNDVLTSLFVTQKPRSLTDGC
jgi:hypothetical protein